MSGLGRLNLLVGTNNSGKTSVLQAIFLLTSAGSPGALWQVLSTRGERLLTEQPGSPLTLRTNADVRHLFRSHEIQCGSKFILSALNQMTREVKFEISEIRPRELDSTDGDSAPASLVLEVTGHPQPDVSRIALNRSGMRDAVEGPRRSALRAGGALSSSRQNPWRSTNLLLFGMSSRSRLPRP